MAEIHFDANKQRGITRSTDGYEIHYIVHRISGIGEGNEFQVDFEAAGDFIPKQSSLVFKPGLESIKLEGHTFHIDNI